MTDRPIIFSGSMMRALLSGRKTQTRRVIKPCCNMSLVGQWDGYPLFYDGRRLGATTQPGFRRVEGDTDERPIYTGSTQYRPGDRLWVREAHAILARPDQGMPANVAYRADAEPPIPVVWRSSIHMPRWASRLTVTVTDVRVQRLQEISEADAVAEGVCSFAESLDQPGAWEGLRNEDRLSLVRSSYGSAVQAYRHLWDTLHGPEAWVANPWVVALTFTVERRNIDALREAA